MADTTHAEAARRLTLTLVTPKGQLAARAVDEVVAPGSRGEFGVLPGHIPFLTSLHPGVLMFRAGTTKEYVAVGAGYVQVGAGDRVQILVDRAETAEEIDETAAGQELEAALVEMKAGSATPADFAVLEDKVAWAQAKLTAAKGGHAGGAASH